jgi:hypothetical protein
MHSRRVALALSVVAAVTTASPGWAAGVLGGRAGVSIAKADVEATDLFDEDNRTGFAGTAFLALGDGILSLQPEASYIQKGVGDIALDYAEVAALLKVGAPIVPNIAPHAFAGIGADFEINKDSPLEIDTETVDWNAIFGADVFLDMGLLTLVVDARYALGLRDIRSAGDAVSDLKNRAWLISAGAGVNF